MTTTPVLNTPFQAQNVLSLQVTRKSTSDSRVWPPRDAVLLVVDLALFKFSHREEIIAFPTVKSVEKTADLGCTANATVIA